jgi:hypothetical protein
VVIDVAEVLPPVDADAGLLERALANVGQRHCLVTTRDGRTGRGGRRW